MRVTKIALIAALAFGLAFTANCKKYAKQDTETLALLALLLPMDYNSTCGKPSSGATLLLKQIVLGSDIGLGGVGSAPWEYNVCQPKVATDANNNVAVYTYDTNNNRITSVVTTTPNTVSAGSANPSATNVTGCQDNATGTTGVQADIVTTTAYEYDSNGNVLTETTTAKCGSSDRKGTSTGTTLLGSYLFSPAQVKKVYTYNSNNAPLTVKMYYNLANTQKAASLYATVTNVTTTTSFDANPVAEATITYTPESGVPTSIAVSAKVFYVEVDISGVGTAETTAVTSVGKEVVGTRSYTITLDSSVAGAVKGLESALECKASPDPSSTSSTGKVYSNSIATTFGYCAGLSNMDIGNGVTAGGLVAKNTATYNTNTVSQDKKKWTYTITNDSKMQGRLISVYSKRQDGSSAGDGTNGTSVNYNTTTPSVTMFAYDDQGRIVQMGTQYFTYDETGLIQLNKGGTITTYAQGTK